MKRMLAVVLALAGLGLAIGRLLRHRRPPPPAPPHDPRADDLRRRLAEHRAGHAEYEPSTEAVGVPSAPETPSVLESVADARRRVYERGRAAVEDMRRSGSEPAA